ncbi:MAG: hypothetical protein EBR67_07470 [Proteobacteria bacterium]|nr:hypothetical protein [Pseudomonadota bacterium]
MSGRDITAVIGQGTYYEQVGTQKSFKDASGKQVEAYLVKITKADDKNRKGKFALITSTKKPGEQPSGDQYVTDITYGEQCDLLEKLKTPGKVTLSTRTFDGTVPVDNPDKVGTKEPTETIADKEWDLKANETEWKGLGASLPPDVTNACPAKAPGTASSAPAVSNTDLGERDIYDASGKVKQGANLAIKFDKGIKAVDPNGNIIVKADGGRGADDITLTQDMYKIDKDSLIINEKGIENLKLAPGGKITVKAGQIGSSVDGTPTSSDITVSHTEKAEAASPSPSPSPLPSPSAPAPDANLTANIVTQPRSGFPKAGPIELTFENVIRLASGKKLDDSTVSVYAVDPNTGLVIPDTKEASLQYGIQNNKLTITRSSGEFIAETIYRVAISPDVLLNDDGNAANPTPVTYDFIAKTPTK